MHITQNIAFDVTYALLHNRKLTAMKVQDISNIVYPSCVFEHTQFFCVRFFMGVLVMTKDGFIVCSVLLSSVQFKV